MDNGMKFPDYLIATGWIGAALLALGALTMAGWHIADKLKDRAVMTGPLKCAAAGVVLCPPLTFLLGAALVYGGIAAITGAWAMWIGDVALVLGAIAVHVDDLRRARRDARREAELAVADTAEQIIRDELAKIGETDGAH